MILVASSQDTLPPVWQITSTFGYFTGLAGALGFSMTYLVTVPRPAGTARERLNHTSSRLLAGAAALLLLVGYLQLAARTARGTPTIPYAQALAPDRIWALLRTPALPGEWISIGSLTAAQNLAFVSAAALLFAQARPAWAVHRRRFVIVAAALLITASAARSVPRQFQGLTMTEILHPVLIQGHIIGGTIWIGGLAFLTLLALNTRTPDRGLGAVWAPIWQRFSTLALVAVGTVLISGLWLTWKEFGHISQIWTTTYGRFLLIKLALVSGLLTAGGYNQIVLMPKIAARRTLNDLNSVWSLTVRHFPRVVAIETTLGIGVLVIVPFLFGSPRQQAGDNGPEHTASWTLLALGVLLTATLPASFVAAARTCEKVSKHDDPNTSQQPTNTPTTQT